MASLCSGGLASRGYYIPGRFNTLTDLQTMFPVATDGTFVFVGNPPIMYEWIDGAWVSVGSNPSQVRQDVTITSGNTQTVELTEILNNIYVYDIKVYIDGAPVTSSEFFRFSLSYFQGNTSAGIDDITFNQTTAGAPFVDIVGRNGKQAIASIITNSNGKQALTVDFINNDTVNHSLSIICDAKAVGGSNITIPAGSPFEEELIGDGITQTYTLRFTPLQYTLEIHRNGIEQNTPNDYTISGRLVTLTVIPAVGEIVVFQYNH